MRRNKKALSEVVGYTLLIVIALAMAGMVYTFLKVYIPKQSAQCEEDINLIVQEYSCSASQGLTITLVNKGLFSADAAYIRLGEQASKIKTQINKENIYFVRQEGGIGLNPGEKYTSSYPISSTIPGAGTYGLDVQPAIVKDRRIILCEKAQISQTIECSS